MTRLSGTAQGTYYAITYCDSQGRDLQPQIDSLLDDFDMTASLWKDSSMIRRINNGDDSLINDCFAFLINKSVAMHNYTDGSFDCTVGGIVNAWGFGFSKKEELSGNTIDSMMKYVGKQPCVVEKSDGTLIVRKPHKETTLDFNAIAQGYSTDIVSDFLLSKGISNFIVDIGGEVYAKGCKPDGTLWKVGIERPAENKYDGRQIETIVELRDESVVTSGSYRKYYEKEGVRYSHTIDPKNGYPVTHTLLSVTVIDTAAWRADALATAFMVMGLDSAKAFIESHPNDSGTQAVLFIYNQDGEYKTYATEGFNNKIAK